MARLAERGVVPKAIKHVKKAQLCTACLFAKAQQWDWRKKEKKKSVRKPCHDAPGKGTSVDHMISHQPGIIPQVTGILTSEWYWGSVTMVDHATDFVYSHLIKGTTVDKTLTTKHAYEHLMSQFGHRVHSYYGNNSSWSMPLECDCQEYEHSPLSWSQNITLAC
eukprot:5260972-Ditylum_brightwellii.AAC.1